MNHQPFSDRIKELIKQHNSVANLARKSGISESAIKKWRDGNSDPSRENLVTLAQATGVDLVWLAIGTKSNEQVEKHLDEGLRQIDRLLFNEVIQAVRSDESELKGAKLELISDDVVAIYNAAVGLPQDQRANEIRLQVNRKSQLILKQSQVQVEALSASMPEHVELHERQKVHFEERLQKLEQEEKELVSQQS